uniref:Uncharacterized protein n=1 Tax=Trichuris muris TaxID=70415 RepID=A0A5S6R5U1_TRIMR
MLRASRVMLASQRASPPVMPYSAHRRPQVASKPAARNFAGKMFEAPRQRGGQPPRRAAPPGAKAREHDLAVRPAGTESS